MPKLKRFYKIKHCKKGAKCILASGLPTCPVTVGSIGKVVEVNKETNHIKVEFKFNDKKYTVTLSEPNVAKRLAFEVDYSEGKKPKK